MSEQCICEQEEIVDCEIQTRESGWFSIDDDIKYCPFCGRKLCTEL
jgi:hypothetical protein